MRVINIMSFGAGVNTGAMMTWARLKGIKIDIALWADVGCEDDRTYRWIDQEAIPYLKKERIKFIRCQSELGSLYDDCWDKCYLPYASVRSCTDKFKIRPIKKFIENNFSNDFVFSYIGYDADEPIRIIRSHKFRHNYTMAFPLVQWGINRNRCKKLIQALDLRVPPKSRCTICPNRQESGFYDLWKNERHNFIKSMELEERVMKERKLNVGFLNDPRKRLKVLDLKWKSQSKLCRYFPVPSMMLEYKPIKEKVV